MTPGLVYYSNTVFAGRVHRVSEEGQEQVLDDDSDSDDENASWKYTSFLSYTLQARSQTTPIGDGQNCRGKCTQLSIAVTGSVTILRMGKVETTKKSARSAFC